MLYLKTLDFDVTGFYGFLIKLIELSYKNKAEREKMVLKLNFSSVDCKCYFFFSPIWLVNKITFRLLWFIQS
jgi:hypothetical protein